jgi:hypothetical protein
MFLALNRPRDPFERPLGLRARHVQFDEWYGGETQQIIYRYLLPSCDAFPIAVFLVVSETNFARI